MTVLTRGERSLHSGYTAANNEYMLLFRYRKGPVHLAFAAYFGIDGANEVTVTHSFGKADKATDTLAYLIDTTAPYLIGEVGIADNLTPHINNIRFTRSEDLLHLKRVAQTADGTDKRFSYMFFYFCRVFDVNTRRIKHANMRARKCFRSESVYCADRDMD